jgi:hypothetical protein
MMDRKDASLIALNTELLDAIGKIVVVRANYELKLAEKDAQIAAKDAQIAELEKPKANGKSSESPEHGAERGIRQ